MKIELFWAVLGTTLFMLISLARANPPPGDKDFTIKDKKVGTIFLSTRMVEEPASKPMRITVTVKCRNGKSVEAKSFKTCDYVKHEYDRKGHELIISHRSAHVAENGEVTCNIEEVEEIALSKACNK